MLKEKITLDRTEKLMRTIAGKPRAAIVAIWPTLGNHCRAGVVLINRKRAETQRLPVQCLEFELDPEHIKWTLEVGFINGCNVYGITPFDALTKLHTYLIFQHTKPKTEHF